ncbi:restriction endonuclease subunit S [Rothia mucilaginosa]|uniref:restriction endonuclease subunit S n=1 Tax=Rothia mucilaginosa TaxID=43675 RepID=UPI0028D4096D|nr:restriction endonuclease subunit S [Rothia mucilaginosa]
MNQTLIPLKYAATITLGKMLQNDASSLQDVELPYVRAASIGQDGKLRYSDAKTMWFKPNEIEMLSLLKGDVLVVEGGDVGRSIVLSQDEPGWGFQNSINRVRPFPGNDGRFLQYQIEHLRACGYLRLICNAVSFHHLTAEKLAAVQIRVPTSSQQQGIADYLDIETAKIDHLIAKQRELISLLEERLSAFMEDALVKGISHDNASPMEWRRVKHLFKLRDERNHLEREEVTLLSLYAKHGVRKYDEIEERTGNPVRTVQDYKCVHAGDIIVNIILAWMGSIGRSPHDGVISPAYDIWTPLEGVSSRYYHYLFRTKWFSGECYKRGKGIMMMRWRTYADQFGDIRVPFPTQQEQDYLVNLIEREESQVQNLISKCQRMIDLLQERRSALITAAVTGQIEV